MKNVIVTGLSHGIGKEIAKTLSEKYNIIGIDMSEYGGHFANRFYLCDLSDRGALLDTISRIKDDFSSIYALVNNAGIFINKPLNEQTDDDWDKVVATNLTAPYILSREFSLLLSSQKGHIINISSTRALMSESGTEPYSASKGGISSLTHALAMSLAPDVSVNSISPGWINTDEDYIPTKADNEWHPSGRVGTPKDIADLVMFLIGRDGGFITGGDFVVDGGVTKKMVYP